MKVIIFSHESDIDGMGPVVLGNLAFERIDYVLSPNPQPMELKFREYLEKKKLYDYDYIFITDLALDNPSLDMVYSDKKLKNKVLIFDHHQKAIELGLNRYSFTFIEEKDKNGKKRCATEIFYEYLINNNFINRKESIDTFVEFTRLEDTWDWKRENNTKAHDLAVLFNKIGITDYINRMTNKLKNNNCFTYDEEELRFIREKKKEYEDKIKRYVAESEVLKDENNNKYGITYAPYEFRNDIPEYIRNNNINDICYFITVALDKEENGQKSYRSIKEGFDVNEIAMRYNGGGHPSAAAVSITKEQRKKIENMKKKEGLEYLANSRYENI